MIGNSVKKVSVILKKAGNTSGTYNRDLVRKGTGDSISITFGTIAAATLTTTDQTFTLEAPTSHTFAANDKVPCRMGWNRYNSRSGTCKAVQLY